MVELEIVKTLNFGLEGVMEEDTALGHKKKVERKLMLRSSATNSEFEVITQSVSAKKMSAIVRKEEVELDCIDTSTKEGSRLHSGEAQEQLFEVQSISD